MSPGARAACAGSPDPCASSSCSASSCRSFTTCTAADSVGRSEQVRRDIECVAEWKFLTTARLALRGGPQSRTTKNHPQYTTNYLERSVNVIILKTPRATTNTEQIHLSSEPRSGHVGFCSGLPAKTSTQISADLGLRRLLRLRPELEGPHDLF